MTFFNLFLAFLGGALGSMFSAMGMIVVFCLCGILAPFIQNTFFNESVMGVMLAPVCCFAAGIPAVAFSANTRHRSKDGLNLFEPQWNVSNDWTVHLVGGVFGVCMFSLMHLFSRIGIPGDVGALAIVVANLVLRKVCYRQKIVTCPPEHRGDFGKHLRKNYSRILVTPIILGIISGLVVYYTKNIMIMFYIGGFSLLMLYFEPNFPITHHMGMVASILASTFGSQSPVAAAAFGALGAIIAQIIFELVVVYLNYGKMDADDRDVAYQNQTHIDPPSITIATCSILAALIANLIG